MAKVPFTVNDIEVDGTTLTVDEINNRVGIGTNTPVVALDVVGVLKASDGVITLTSAGTPSATIADGALAVDVTNDKLFIRSGSSWVNVGISDHGDLAGLGDDDHTQYLLADGTRTASSLTVSGDFTVDTSTFKVDSSNNRVGINTTSPTATLTVVDSGSSTVYVKTSEVNGVSRIQLSEGNYSVPTSGFEIKYDGVANHTSLGSYNGNTTFREDIGVNRGTGAVSISGSLTVGDAVSISGPLTVEGDDIKKVFFLDYAPVNGADGVIGEGDIWINSIHNIPLTRIGDAWVEMGSGADVYNSWIGPYNDDMILVFDTSLGDTTISVPLSGTVNCTVDWGDGSSDSYTTGGDKSHTYSAGGVYIVRISGSLTGFGTTTTGGSELTACLSFGNIGLTSLYRAFFGRTNLVTAPAYLPSTVTNISELTRNATSFNSSGLISWDLSNVTNIIRMFDNTDFNQDIGSWDISGVTNLSYVFHLSDFNQDISGWDTSSVTQMQYTFAYGVEKTFDIGSWDVSSLTNATNMFFASEISTYDSLLIGWAAQSVNSGVVFHAGSSKYTTAAAAARNTLTNTYGWTITDGGPA